MAEPKRIAVTQVGAVEKKEKKEKRRFSHRFTLSLNRSTEKTCPEFSFNELLKNALGDAADFSDNDDPFANQDRAEQHKLEALAKSFEEKYAHPKPAKKKKKGPYNRIQEFVDLGDGYDEADPFIDNTEAYDELVPSCLTTQHGGFYINSGKLDFRAVSDPEDDFQSTIRRKHKNKNRITSDSDSESVPKKRQLKKFKLDDELRKRKRKKLSSTESMGKPLLKRKKFDRDGYKSLKLKKKKSSIVGVPTASSVIPNGVPASMSNGTKTDQQDVAMSSVARQNMELAIDSVITQSRNMDDVSEDGDSQSMSPHSQAAHTNNPQDIPQLPDPIPPRIKDLVSKLKQAASDWDCEEKGKKKFFTPLVNQMLLSVENGSRQLPAGIRNAIYNHLAAYLPCGKETLMKRAKKLHTNQHDDKLKEPLAKIKEAINKVMPALIEKHQAELQTVQLKKLERKREAGSTESDEESEKRDADKQKRIMAPRKKFEYSSETRNLLNHIVQIKMNHYEVSRTRAQTPEDYLKTFLEQLLLPLWPVGWMQTRLLYKESKGVHGRWTNPGASSKPRKSLVTTAGRMVTSSGIPGSKPSSQVTNNISTTTASTVSTPTDLSTTPGVKHEDSSSNSSSDSSYSSSDSASPRAKNILDYATDKYNGSTIVTDSKHGVAASKAPVKTEVKSSGSLGFVPAVSSERSAAQVLQNITASLSKSKLPSASHPTPPKQPEESSKMTFLDQFYQFAAGAQGVTSTTGETLQDVPTASVSATQPVASVKQAISTTNTVPKHATTTPKTDTKTTTVQHVASKVSKGSVQPSHSSPGRGIDPTSKPHLAAALQGMYYSTSTTPGTTSSHSTTHSQVSSTTKPQGKAQVYKTVTVVGQGQSPASNSGSSNLSQAKVLEHSQSRQHLANQQASSGNSLLQQKSTLPNQVRISHGSNSQKQVSSTTHSTAQSKSGVSPASGQTGKKFHVSQEGISMIKAGLVQAANQMAHKVQEKQTVSAPKRTSPVPVQTGQSMKQTSLVSPQLSQSVAGRTTASPVQHQKVGTPVSQKVGTPVSQKVGTPVSYTGQKGAIPVSHTGQKVATPVSHTGQKVATVVHQTIQNVLSQVPQTIHQVATSMPHPSQRVATLSPQVVQKVVSQPLGHLTSIVTQVQNSQVTPHMQTSAHVSPASAAVFAVPSPVSSKSVAVNQVSSTSSIPSKDKHVTKVTTYAASQSSNTELKQHSSASNTSRQLGTQLSPVQKAVRTVASTTHPGGRSASSPVTVTVRPLPPSPARPSSSPQTTRAVASVSKPGVSVQQVVRDPQRASYTIHSTTTHPVPPASSHHMQPSHSSPQASRTTHPQSRVSVTTVSNTSPTTYPKVSYQQKAMSQSRPDSTSPSRSSEPKFGGLTLSQIQEQTLKASHQAAQYTSQMASTPPLFRPAENTSIYGSAQLTNFVSQPSRSSQNVTGYSSMAPTTSSLPPSPTVHRSPESAGNLYGLPRTAATHGHHATSPGHNLFPSVPVSPSSMLRYNLPYTDPSQHRY